MPGGVVDASVAISWCFADQASPATDRLFERVRDEGAVVPALWFWEVGNVLVRAERRGRMAPGDSDRRMALMSALPLWVDQAGIGHAWGETVRLARIGQLSVYDASYLELSLRRALPLFTQDGPLADAARAQGVLVLPH
jgi:predicted nucleic acid-binding protein